MSSTHLFPEQLLITAPAPSYFFLYINRSKYFVSGLFYDTSARHERHEPDKKTTTATWVKNFDFDNDTRLQGKKQFHYMNYLLKMPRFHSKMRLKSAPQNLNFVMAKAISKSYNLDCSWKTPCTFPDTVCNFQSMKSPIELNSIFSKLFYYITWFVISPD